MKHTARKKYYVGRFVPWDVFSLGTLCPLGRFVFWDVLSLGTFCLWDILSLGRFVSWDVLSLGPYVWGRFVLGRFVLERFVCMWQGDDTGDTVSHEAPSLFLYVTGWWYRGYSVPWGPIIVPVCDRVTIQGIQCPMRPHHCSCMWQGDDWHSQYSITSHIGMKPDLKESLAVQHHTDAQCTLSP